MKDSYLIQELSSINYMGSKTKLLNFLMSHIPYGKDLTFLDGFSGSIRVGGSIQTNYKSITSVDTQLYSELLGKALLTIIDDFDIDIIKKLNGLKPKDGFITETYGGEIRLNNSSIQDDGKTRLFIRENAGKIQAMRDYIEDNNLGILYLYGLIIAAAKVQSSTGHQNGYLKTFSKNSLKPINYKAVLIPLSHNKHLNKVLRGDIFNFISEYHDIFYFDPPYGTINTNVPVATRYTAFYHFWNTLVLNDTPEIFGMAQRRLDSKGVTDQFEVNKKDTYLPLIKKLFDESNGKHIFISLSNQSIVTKEEILSFCSDYNIKVFEKSHSVNVQGIRTKKIGKYSVKKKPLKEYLYYLKK